MQTRVNWGNVTLREHDAMDTIGRDADLVLEAANRWRREYLPALIVAADEPTPDPDRPFFPPEGEEWVRDLCARMRRALENGDELGQLTAAREWMRGVGFMGVSNIKRHLLMLVNERAGVR